ncbi:MAG: RNase P modulator RnpM [Lachnospirales bacterium]
MNKKIPMRKCTGCQEMKSKKELIRIVRSDDGSFFLDETGKKSGRGAYICKNSDCLNKAFKNKGLERSFKSAVPSEVYDKLRAELGDKNE